MPDFLTTAPDKTITDPKNLRAQNEYPAHLHRAVTVETDPETKKPIVPDGVLVVAWQGKTPIYNEVRVVADASEKKAALTEGFVDGPDLPKVKAAKGDK